MNLKLIRERLTSIEQSARRWRDRQVQEPGQTVQMLRRLTGDPTAMELYNRALVETEKIRCFHQRYGWCPACLDGSQAVQAAWAAVQIRMDALSVTGASTTTSGESAPNNSPTKEETP